MIATQEVLDSETADTDADVVHAHALPVVERTRGGLRTRLTVAMALLAGVAGCDSRTSEQIEADRKAGDAAWKKQVNEHRRGRLTAEQANMKEKAAKIPELMKHLQEAKPDSVEHLQATIQAQEAVKELMDWNKKYPDYAVDIPGAEKPKK